MAVKSRPPRRFASGVLDLPEGVPGSPSGLLTNDRRRLSRRGAGAEDEPLYEGIPDHLWTPLLEWFNEVSDERRLRIIALKIRVAWSPDSFTGLLPTALKSRGDEGVLDAIDAMLFEFGQYPGTHPEVDYSHLLDNILQMGGSAWRVSTDGLALERRIEPAVRDAFDRAVQDAQGTSAGQHLTDAFSATYRRPPDPSKAYSESIKAIEAAAAPVVTPNDLKATLGTIIGEMRAQPAAYEFTISPGDASTVVAMMAQLWNGHTDRHGGNKPTVLITPAAGAAAVHLAATLVEWFASGALRRR